MTREEAQARIRAVLPGATVWIGKELYAYCCYINLGDLWIVEIHLETYNATASMLLRMAVAAVEAMNEEEQDG